jgi:hypothetical protein
MLPDTMSSSLLIDLLNLFRDARISTSCHRHIFTDEQIATILTPDRVRGLLQDEVAPELHLLDKYTSLVSEKATKILSILIHIGRVSHMLSHFVQLQIWDTRLPLDAASLPAAIASSFREEQVHFLAPKIELNSFYEWPGSTILPFNLDEPITDGEGSFGRVYRITIVPQYQKLQNSVPPEVYHRNSTPRLESLIESSCALRAKSFRLSDLIEALLNSAAKSEF